MTDIEFQAAVHEAVKLLTQVQCCMYDTRSLCYLQHFANIGDFLSGLSMLMALLHFIFVNLAVALIVHNCLFVQLRLQCL